MHWKIRCSVVLAGVLLAASAEAARVTQVRVGDHAKFTRIVVELDAPATYSWEKNAASGVSELVLDVDASTATRVVTSRSRLVESVALRPGSSGAVARVQLRGGDVQVKEMLLKAPYRIVLDISAASPTPAAKPAPTPRKAVVRAPAPSAPQPEPVVPAARPVVVADADNALDEAEAVAAAAMAAAEAEAEAEALAALDPEQEAEADAIAADADASPEAAADEIADPAEPTRSDPDRMAEASGDASEEAEAAPVAASGGGDSGMGLTLALVGIAVLLVALMLVRRRSERIAREAAAAPWPPPGAEERPEFATAIAEEEAPHVPGAPETSGALFGGASEAEPEAAELDDAPAPAPAVSPPVSPPVPAGLRAEPEVVAKEDALVVEELERRIERLEARLSDSLDARERLERQLAAHTEELRVQRAAIARTQRAVRAAVRGPEAAAEESTVVNPIPGPGSTGSADH